MRREKFFEIGLSYSFLIFFGLCLAIPSGYSYGAVGALVCSIYGIFVLKQARFTLSTWWLITTIFLMGVIWSLSFENERIWTGTDLWLKYWLAAFVLGIASIQGVQYKAVEWGLGLGCLGALLIAFYQNVALGIPKATGYTNAIQYGGIAMYLGLATWAVAVLGKRQLSERLIFIVLGTCGVLASVLSETRGAWVAAIVLLVFAGLLLVQHGFARWVLAGTAIITLIVSALFIPYGKKIEARVDRAIVEVQQYAQAPEVAAVTSVGQRLEQWRAALKLIQMKPLTGWGNWGNGEGKQMLVDKGLAHPSITDYGHAHNEIIDMLARRGLIGCFFLLLFYLVPIWLFWPSRNRIDRVAIPLKQNVLAIRLIATMLPVAYFVFGWTQVFFAHNSGNMFYLFSLAAFWGALQRLENKTLHKLI